MHQIIFLCRTLPLYFKKRLKENIIFTVYTNVHISTLNSPYVNLSPWKTCGRIVIQDQYTYTHTKTRFIYTITDVKAGKTELKHWPVHGKVRLPFSIPVGRNKIEGYVLVSPERCNVQCIPPISICQLHISTKLDQKFHKFKVAIKTTLMESSLPLGVIQVDVDFTMFGFQKPFQFRLVSMSDSKKKVLLVSITPWCHNLCHPQ